MISFQSKLPKTGTNIFSVMSALAQQADAINLSQGFPDFECSPELVSLVNQAMQQGHNQYAPMTGLLSLREAIAAKTQELYGASYHPDNEITVTAGGTQAIFTAICATIHPNDEVIIFEPAYDCYAPAIQLMGGVVKRMELEPPDYRINWTMVRRLISSHTKMVILNSPHNPTATVLQEEDIRELISLTHKTDILILSDEVYEHIIFDGQPHRSMARYPELAERSLIVASFGKLFHITGWKVGYCMAPAWLMNEFRKIHQFNVFSVNTPMQYALADFLQVKEAYLGLADFYQQKRDYFRSGLESSRFELLPCAGAYFQSVKFNHISEDNDLLFAKTLIDRVGVAAVPNSAFYSKKTDFGILRFCFAKKQETLTKAVEQLLKV
ncbi:methionine aminotransferase [Mucilaginibacter arboris]|uniref:Aminotransferase class I/II-fold pyridoxal phosphate-dependent enzyme n=1 Tax=Mucilaginibacter arboris TaxID=2682090 RepID=A0A7K1SZL8_9SPHI|nr:methionine aminotransferase [Mucilaginibacter arboris]MVN22762.1 aminotransferase class I/II-fold pyridoxal phosphate-dependent enzyme [Mucilaginibacter arboris]